VTCHVRADLPHLTQPVRRWCKLYDMAQIPTPLRAALGLVANAIEGARTLPDKAVELPVMVVSTALQFSLRAQQRYAEFTLRGDELIGRLRGLPDEPPPWATFDDEPGNAATEAELGTDDAAIAAAAESPEQVAAELRAESDAAATGADSLPAPIVVEHPDANATAARGPAQPGAAKSATKQPRTRKAATAKKDRPGKTAAERADAPDAADSNPPRPEANSRPSAFDEVEVDDGEPHHAAPEPSGE
jgi:hypothetical protein